MATFYGSGVGGNYPERMTIRTDATIVSQSVAENYSIIRLKVYGYYNYTNYNTVDPIGNALGYIRIDQPTGSTNYAFSASQNFSYAGTSSSNMVFIMDWTSGKIYHNSDGTKTINVDVYQNCPGVSTLNYLYDSFDWTLTTIPRSSTPTLSASSVALGSPVTIYTNRADSGLKHSFDYKIGSANVTFATSVEDSYTWTLPLDIANQLPTSTSGAVTITCYTWAGGVHIGTKTITLTATVPNNSNFQPTASFNNIAEGTAAMVGAGFYLAGKSSIYVASAGTGKYSASISSYSVTVNGTGYSGSSITSAVISSTGTITVSLTVTDSRGFTGSVSETKYFTTLPAPTLSASSVSFGSGITIYTDRPTANVTSTLYYKIGSIGDTQIVSSVGDSYAWTVPNSAIGGFTNAASGTVTVIQNFYNGANYLGSTTNAFTGTIPKSIPTTNVSTADLGATITVSTNRVHASLTHKLYYAFGSVGKTLLANIAIADSNYPWTTTSALASALTTAKSGTLTFTLDTYKDLTLIGSNTKTITMTIPENGTYTPTVTATVAEGTATMVGSGAYIAGHSSIKVTSTGVGKLGATIVSYAVTVNGSPYSGSAGTPSVATSAVIASSGPIPVVVTVTDSRGYTGAYPTSVSFVAIAAPTFNLSTVALGGGAASAVTITTNRASTFIKHTLKYTYGTASGTLGLEKDVQATHLWTLDNSLASGVPDATSGTVTVTQESYFNATLLGTKTATFTSTIPNIAAFQPVPTIASIVEGTAGLGVFTTNNVFIQGKSKLTVTSSAAFKFGAGLSQYKVIVDGVTYIGSPITSAIITKSGSINVTLEVTDSRGYKGTTAPIVKTFEPYATPEITAFDALRAPDDQGSDLSTPINFTISSLASYNSKSYKIEYRPAGGNWATAHGSVTLYTLNTTLLKVSVLDINLSYEVRLTLSDSFVTVASKIIPIGTGFSLMDFRSTGKGMAIGKVSEKDALEVALPLHALKGISFQDTRSIDDEPQTRPDRAISFDLKSASAVGNPPIKASATYAHIITVAGWNTTDSSGGWPSQLSIGADGIAVRQATSATAWGPWKAVGGSSALDAYPIGAIYLSATATNPGTIFGGTWAAFGTGRTLVGIDTAQAEFNTVEKTGGHKNLQSHTHTGSSGNAGGHGHTASSGNAGGHGHTASSGTTGSHTHTGTAANAGGHGHAASSGAAGYHGHTGSAASAGYHNHTQHGYWRFAPGPTGNYGRARNNISTDPLDSGADSAIDGAGSHTHTITADAVGDHSHTVSVAGAGDHSHTVSVAGAGDHSHTVSVAVAADHAHTVSVVAAANHAHTVTVESTGAGNAENLQPYITVYMWKRTA